MPAESHAENKVVTRDWQSWPQTRSWLTLRMYINPRVSLILSFDSLYLKRRGNYPEIMYWLLCCKTWMQSQTEMYVWYLYYRYRCFDGKLLCIGSKLRTVLWKERLSHHHQHNILNLYFALLFFLHLPDVVFNPIITT